MLNKKILHICNGYLGSSIYHQLYTKLSELGVEQIVYCPLRGKGQESKYIEAFPTYETKFSDPLKIQHRFIFHQKVRYLLMDINRKVNLESIGFTHATTLFSDGALAYRLYIDHNLPYLLTVRNTDLNIFLKYMFHLRPLVKQILANAKKVVFISPSYARRFLELPFIRQNCRGIGEKSIVIPNGVDNFWINNLGKRKVLREPVELLYIGRFAKNKNIAALIQAVKELNAKRNVYRLNIVGGGAYQAKLKKLIDKSDFVIYHGRVDNKIHLKQLIEKCHIFTMPSLHETFGLVYIEALSQGLPVLYTQGEGIDGFYNEQIGEAVNASDIESIKNGIVKIVENYDAYNFNAKEILENHDWLRIAKSYLQIYTS